jgi:imidazolonepropionase-like amidohydrolase
VLSDPKPPVESFVLHDASVFDGTGAPPVHVESLVVRDGRLSTMPAPAGSREIDLQGRFLMPGLIDAHAHLAEYPRVVLGEGVERLHSGVQGHLVAAEARKALRMGITTLRDVGARGNTILTLRQAMRHGAFLGPRILTCGRIVSATSPGGRHFEGMYREADGPDDMRRAAREQMRRGADFVKIMVTGARSVELENPNPPQLTRKELRALVDEVHRQGYLVAAHCEGLEGTALAIEEGVDTIEHGFYLNQRPELLKAMTSKHQTLVPTLSFLRDVVASGEWSDELMERGRYNVDEAHKTLVAALDAGVAIAMGFDSAPEEQAAGELREMVEAGMPNTAALVAATSAAATALGLDALIGTIEEGKMADLIVVEGDPLTSIDHLTDPARVRLVLRGGHLAYSSL